MKKNLRFLLPLLGVALLAPATRAADDSAQVPKKSERREMRVLIDRPDKERPKEPVTFLGVETIPVSPTLVAQLGLADGAGLVVAHVVPDSPAAGVLKEHDILVKLDDQLLIETRQFAVLVRNHKEGDEVTLTFIRGGKPQTAKVKLAKHEVPKFSLNSFNESGGVGAGGAFGRTTGEALERTRAELLKRESELRSERARMMDLLQSAPAQSSVRIIEREGGPTPRVSMLNPGKSQMVYSDDAGTLELKIDDGQKELVAKDAKGTVLFSGPINTPEERQALPESVRPRLEKVLQMRGVSFEPGADFRIGTPVARPATGRPISLPVIPRPQSAPLPANQAL
jgi:serine protease Do